MKRVALFVIALSALGNCAKGQRQQQGPPPSARPRILEQVLEARPIRLETPALFWREGRQQPADDLVVLRVKVTNPFFFEPKGVAPPLFVYGDTVCETLQGPFPSGEAILLAPRQPNGMGFLWLSPIGMQPQEADREAVRIHRAQTEREKRGLPVREETAGTPAAYRGLAELKDEILRRR